MSWQQFGGNLVRLSRTGTWTCTKRRELQASGVRPPARVIRREDRHQHTTDAVDGLNIDCCWSSKLNRPGKINTVDSTWIQYARLTHQWLTKVTSTEEEPEHSFL